MAPLQSKRFAHTSFDRQSDLPSPSSNRGACTDISRYLSKSIDSYKENGLFIRYTDVHVKNSVCLFIVMSIILFVGLLVGCLSSQQHASVSQGRICSDNFTCCHTEIEVADQAFYLTQSQYTDTGPTSPSADPITPGAWQGSHWSANF